MAGFNQGLFLDTTEVLDTSFLQESEYTNEQLRQIFIQVIQAFNSTNLAVNLKDTGIYALTEFVNGQTFFPDPALSSQTQQSPAQRQAYRKTFTVGPLTNATTKTIAHDIDVINTFTFTRIYGAAFDSNNLVEIPIPFVSVSGHITAGNIELYADGTNIYITPTGNATNFDIVIVVLEYLKS